MGCLNTSGIVTAGLVARYDRRPMAFVAAIGGPVGIMLVSLAPSLVVMPPHYAMIGPFFNLGFMSTSPMVPKYLTTKRGIAVGIAGGGYGMGQAI